MFVLERVAMGQPLQQLYIEDPEGFHEFREALSDYSPRIENLLYELSLTPDDADKLADLFRLFHNIKGDAALCRLDFFSPLVHAVENLLTRLRSGEIQYTERLRDVLILSLDRIELTIEALDEDKPVSSIQLSVLEQGLDGLQDLSGNALESACSRLVDALAGFSTLPDTPLVLTTRSNKERSADLNFFQSLALQLEQRSELFQGRTMRNLTLALNTNQLAGGWVDPEQLEAAVYMHDVGMMFLPEPIWLKAGALSAEERQQLTAHPDWAAGLLHRMTGWSEAAQIVAQHHEKLDGTGYPQGLSGAAICPGAKILALVDAFESVMLKHRHRGEQRSALRAIAEVNASERQFDPAWIEPFNRVVRSMLAGMS
jgi:hypothetical protein